MGFKEITHRHNFFNRREYVVGNSTACHAVWLRRILSNLAHEEKEPTIIFCDNNSTIALSKNHVFHHKSKQIDTFYHFIRKLVNDGGIMLHFCDSKEQLADIFTKPLGRNTFEFQRQHLGIVCADFCNGRN
jgi:hypothetical protein